MEDKIAYGRKLNFIGMIIFILAYLIDRFIFKIPDLLYIIILLIVMYLMFGGLLIRKKARDNEK